MALRNQMEIVNVRGTVLQMHWFAGFILKPQKRNFLQSAFIFLILKTHIHMQECIHTPFKYFTCSEWTWALFYSQTLRGFSWSKFSACPLPTTFFTLVPMYKNLSCKCFVWQALGKAFEPTNECFLGFTSLCWVGGSALQDLSFASWCKL